MSELLNGDILLLKVDNMTEINSSNYNQSFSFGLEKVLSTNVKFYWVNT